jgi:hypothetical protein
MKKLVIAGTMLAFAAPAYAQSVIPGGSTPVPGTLVSVNADDYCSYYICNGRDWWTLYGYGTGAHWDSNSPTMADAPSWLWKRQYKTRRHVLR